MFCALSIPHIAACKVVLGLFIKMKNLYWCHTVVKPLVKSSM